MRLFTRAKPDSFPERRGGPRVRVDCLANMLMPSGDRTGRLFDISTTGARFVTDDPPAKGISAILDWSLHEAYCMVVWAKPGMCGVEFDRPLPQRVIDDLVREISARSRPASTVRPAPAPGMDSAVIDPAAPPKRFVC